jgi:hypothetical protein
VFDCLLTDDGLFDAAKILEGSNVRHLDREVHRDFAVVVHFGQDVDVDADFLEVELRVDQCVRADSAEKA